MLPHTAIKSVNVISRFFTGQADSQTNLMVNPLVCEHAKTLRSLLWDNFGAKYRHNICYGLSCSFSQARFTSHAHRGILAYVLLHQQF